MASLVEPLTRRMAGNADSPPLSPPPPPLTGEAIPTDPLEVEPSRHYSIKTVARALGISRDYVQNCIRTGVINPEKYGPSGNRRLTDADVAKLEEVLSDSSRIGICPKCDGPLKARSCKLWCGRCGVAGSCSDGSI